MRRLSILFIICFLVPFISQAQESVLDLLPPEQPQQPVVRPTPQPQPQPQPPPQEATPPDTTTAQAAPQEAAPEADSLYSERKLWERWEANPDSQTKFEEAIGLSFWVIGIWLFIVVVLLVVLFVRYHFYGGLPRKQYNSLVEEIKNDASIPSGEKAEHYPRNTYHDQTLGLPKGTVRGLLTLTLLVANCLVLYVSTYAPPGSQYKNNTEFITTAFLMMIAFYFGSKAVDVFKAREKTRRKTMPEGGEAALALAGVPASARPGRPGAAAPPAHLRPTTTPEKDVEHEDSKTVKIVAEAGAPAASLDERILALTAYFETGKKINEACSIVAGNFDGMGISFGCLQWNLGQGTLQPILRNYFQFGDGAWKDDPKLRELEEVLERSKTAQLEWARSIQQQSGRKHILLPEWKEAFKQLGPKTKRFQLQATERRFKVARGWCGQLGLKSERALALMFDINVQNGSLFKVSQKRGINVRRSINQRIANAGQPSEAHKLVIIAEERAKASNPKWIKDVLSRKLAIANGQGKVHGANVNLDDFDISLNRPFE